MKVELEIEEVVQQIRDVKAKLVENQLGEAKEELRDEEKRLRTKEEQLREEKKQLRDKELLLLGQKVQQQQGADGGIFV